MARLDETFVQFDLKSILEISADNSCQLQFTSPTTRLLAISALRYAAWPSRWRNLYDINGDPVDFTVCRQLYELAIKELTMGCDFSDLTTSLDRMATAIEAIEAKTPEITTIGDLISNLEGSELDDIADLIAILQWFGVMLPDFGLSIDLPVSKAIEMLTEWRRHSQYLNQLRAMNANLRLLGIAEVGEDAIEIVDEVTDNLWEAPETLLQAVNAGGSLLTGLSTLGLLFRGLFPGKEDLDPDGSESLRVAVRNVNKISNAVDVTVNACCYDIGDHPANDSDLTGQPDPVTPPANWEGTLEQYNAYKCKASNLLVTSYVSYIRNVAGMELVLVGGTVPALIQLFTSTQILPLVFAQFVLAAGPLLVLSYLITVFVAGSSIAGILSSYATNLEAAYDDVVCELFGSLDESEARAAILSWMTNAAPIDLPSGWIEAHLEHWYPNNVLKVLFQDSQVVNSADDGPVDCSGCGQVEQVFYIDVFSGVTCGILISGNYGLGEQTVIESVVAPSFGDSRQQIRLHSVGDVCLDFLCEVVQFGSDDWVWQDGIDCADQAYNLNWQQTASAFPSSVDCKTRSIIGNIIGGGAVPFQIRVTPTTP